MNIKKACKALNVSRSGYYKFSEHKPSSRDIENEAISKEIKRVFEEHKGRYGPLRIAKALEQDGIKVNRKRVARLMRLMGLCPKGTRYKYKNHTNRHQHEEHANLLNQVFKASRKNQIWVGGITCIPTKKRALHLAVFVDAYPRKAVGWAMDTKMKDCLVITAFNQAFRKEHPEPGLIVHTDQGPQFTSGNFQSLLKSRKAVHSESRKGNPYDNALMESFYRTLKRELIQDETVK